MKIEFRWAFDKAGTFLSRIASGSRDDRQLS
jgi:hypothetical protein